MKIADHYKLIKEHPASFELHDSRDGRSFHIAKRGMSDHLATQMKKMPAFADGGAVEPPVGSDIPYDTLIPQEQAQNAPYGTSGAMPPNPADNGVQVASNGPVTMGQVASLPGAPAQAPMAEAPADGGKPEGNPVSDQANRMNSTLDEESQGIKNALKAEQGAAGQTAGAWKDYGEDLSALKSPEDIMADHKKADDDAMAAFQRADINPDHYWANKSTGQKIAAGIGMLLGGWGAGLTGGPNLAIESINRAIDRDMEAQKSNQSKSMNLWKLNREATQSDIQANLQTRNQLLNAVEAKTKMFAARAGGAEAQLKFMPLLMDIQRQKSENYLRLGLAQGGVSNMDPAQAVPMLVKSPEQQKQVFEEIGRAQNVAANQQKILQAFDESSKDNTVMRTGAGYLRTPGSVMALHQLMLPNFKQIDGTVRQAAMDESFHNLTPSPGDTDSKIAAKRQALQDWMTSESAAPTAKGFGLDLSKFRSTNTQSRPPQQIQKMGGVSYIKVPGGWKRADGG